MPFLPTRVCCAGCAPYYREVLVYVPGGASMLALAGLAVLVLWTALAKWRKTKPSPMLTESQVNSGSSIQCSDSTVNSKYSVSMVTVLCSDGVYMHACVLKPFASMFERCCIVGRRPAAVARPAAPSFTCSV